MRITRENKNRTSEIKKGLLVGETTSRRGEYCMVAFGE